MSTTGAGLSDSTGSISRLRQVEAEIERELSEEREKAARLVKTAVGGRDSWTAKAVEKALKESEKKIEDAKRGAEAEALRIRKKSLLDVERAKSVDRKKTEAAVKLVLKNLGVD
ncbi:MAG TPA: hypothetical protein ENN13_03565 [Candidatus Altiarchaeales archaeon]|nr:hypothetical protein [Candidatus Altiarchaeales archaeon]